MDVSDDETHAQQPPPSMPRPANPPDDEADDDWSEEATVTSLKPTAGTLDRSTLAMPLWARRLSRRDKLLRGSVAVLVVLVVLAAIIGGKLPALFSNSPTAFDNSSGASIQVPMLAAHPAVQLPASPWEQIALPSLHDMSWSFAPVPSDPSTVFACAVTDGTQPNGAVQDGPLALWRSYDAGAHWQRLAIPVITGIQCSMQTVSDTGGHVTALVEAFSQKVAIQGNCSSTSAFIISRDGGATWLPVLPHERFSPAHSGEMCYASLTPHHLYLWHYYPSSTGANAGAGQHTLLERSDDGTTWVRADSGMNADAYFYPTIIPGSRDDVVIAGVPYQHGAVSGVTLWRSPDAGRHWQRLGDTERYDTLVASQESPANRSDLASHMLYGLARDAIAERTYALHVAQSTDGQHWAALPALPIAAADADHLGVLETLGVASGGKLLFLGADPHAGIPHAGSDQATWRGDTQWLWAWDPHAQRWDIPQAPLQVAWPETCFQQCWHPHLAWGPGPDGTGYGTYVWVMRRGDATIYRTFVPAS